MAKRPPDVDPETWRRQRAQHWGRVNWLLNGLMVATVIALIIRYLS